MYSSIIGFSNFWLWHGWSGFDNLTDFFTVVQTTIGQDNGGISFFWSWSYWSTFLLTWYATVQYYSLVTLAIFFLDGLEQINEVNLDLFCITVE